jgi:hypothetical protein
VEDGQLRLTSRPDASGQAVRSARVACNTMMRPLLEEYVTWTRLMISVTAALPDRPSTGGCLARSQPELDTDVRPCHGDWARAQIVVLRREHVTRCVALVETAKGVALAQVRGVYYAAGDEIARFGAHESEPLTPSFRKAVDDTHRPQPQKNMNRQSTRALGGKR